MRFEGSSPRVRGKRTSRVAATVLPRLIPARAGKTPWRAPTRAAAWAHPRACGENANMLIRECWARGSSPRVRGKPGAGRVGQGLGRLIPARAGKTGKSMLLAVPVGAHPRACGENGRPGSRRRRAVGSSPRVRGKRMVWPSKTATPRLIPARAGKTPCSVTSTWVPGAHPRACGENPRIPCPVRAQDGSSPRVRGKHFLTWAFTAQAGQILETLEPSAFSGSYSFPGARANGGQRRAHRRGLCTGPALGRPLGAS